MTERPVATSQASTAELITRASEDVSRLIRDEMRLAKADLAATGKQVGVGAGLFGAAGTLGLLGLGALVAAAILGLATTLEPWQSALVVAGGLLLLAAISALTGRVKVRNTAVVPRERVESLKADVAAVTDRGEEGQQ